MAAFRSLFVTSEEDLLEAASMPSIGLFLLMGEMMESTLPELLFGLGASRSGSAPAMALVRSHAVLEGLRDVRFDLDGVLVAPWTSEQVVAHVRSLYGQKSLRRSKTPRQLHGFQMVRGRLSIEYAGRQVLLTPAEFEIARVLLRHLDAPVSRKQFPHGPRTSDDKEGCRSLDALMSRVRRKIESIVAGEFKVRSLYGVGYTLERARRVAK
ncbi:DNA-binding response OmpR family regulator [Variovorax boronicumulans]|uniref:winged helix-turn-helix domain-containing protein n=1 Tax=Variovorax boronicumulans TaxID=436515 RepID=UPI0033914524